MSFFGLFKGSHPEEEQKNDQTKENEEGMKARNSTGQLDTSETHDKLTLQDKDKSKGIELNAPSIEHSSEENRQFNQGGQGPLCQSTLISDYCDEKLSDDYDDLANDIEIYKGSQHLSRSTMEVKPRFGLQTKEKEKEIKVEEKEDTEPKFIPKSREINNLFGSIGERPDEEKLEVKPGKNLGISTMISSNLTGALSMFSGKKENGEKGSKENGKGEQNKHGLLEEDKDQKSKKLRKSTAKPKKVEFTDPSEAVNYLSTRFTKNNALLKRLIDKNIEKWKLIQYMKDKEQELKSKISSAEAELEEMIKVENFDKADQLQTKIELLNSELSSKKSSQFRIDEGSKEGSNPLLSESIQKYLKFIEENIQILSISENKVTSQKLVYQKEEETKISETQEEINNQETKLNSQADTLNEKLEESKQSLKTVEEKVKGKSQEHIEERNKLDEAIGVVDQEIQELERQLKIKVDERHALEEKRQKKNEIIREITSELDDKRYIDDVEKYERRIMVNNERKDELNHQKTNLEETQNTVMKTIHDYDSKIDSFKGIVENLKSKLEEEQKSFEEFKETTKKHEEIIHKYNLFSIKVSDIQNEIKGIENEIEDHRQSLSNDYRKVEEHERMIETLESEKKTLAKKKNFKEAQRTKRLIEMKEKKKETVLQEIEDFKLLIETSEKRLEEVKLREKKLVGGGANIDEEEDKSKVATQLKEQELAVVKYLQRESTKFDQRVNFYTSNRAIKELKNSKPSDEGYYTPEDNEEKEQVLFEAKSDNASEEVKEKPKLSQSKVEEDGYSINPLEKEKENKGLKIENALSLEECSSEEASQNSDEGIDIPQSIEQEPEITSEATNHNKTMKSKKKKKKRNMKHKLSSIQELSEVSSDSDDDDDNEDEEHKESHLGISTSVPLSMTSSAVTMSNVEKAPDETEEVHGEIKEAQPQQFVSDE
ncbi:unnamed protein product [Moneuplotes crassus]|uniref:Uncharacterized protein n=1 Tax=Euplotes crassus TaxID=5936 RepID=A0AAD1XPW4_EUPCR|nr:unnamed protein product [Moneuplotes crassus]